MQNSGLNDTESLKQTKKLLLIVDPQNDFISGSLSVPGGEEAMDDLAEYISIHADEYLAIAISADLHPYNHCSFRQSGGKWPAHGVAYTTGACFYEPLYEAIMSTGLPVTLFHKGENMWTEEFSMFACMDNRAKFKNVLQQHRPATIDICGLAGDVCVLNTLADGIMLFSTEKWHVLKRYSPSLDGGTLLNKFIHDHKITCDD